MEEQKSKKWNIAFKRYKQCIKRSNQFIRWKCAKTSAFKYMATGTWGKNKSFKRAS